MSDYTEEKLQEIDKQRDWWQSAGDVLGLSLVGWTYRISALFKDGNTQKSVEMTGLVAQRLVNVRAALDRADADAREAALQYLSDTGQMSERIDELVAANAALAADNARLAKRVDEARVLLTQASWVRCGALGVTHEV